ncbi:MAG: O-antigen ligase family protein [Ilumatobacteraceae bacterium]
MTSVTVPPIRAGLAGRPADRSAATPRIRDLPVPARFAVVAIALLGVQVHGLASFDVAPSDLLLLASIATGGLRLRYRASTVIRFWLGVLLFGMLLGLFASAAAFTPQSPAWGIVRIVGLLLCIGYALMTSGLSAPIMLLAFKALTVASAVVNALILFAPTRPLIVWLLPQRNIGARLSGGMWDPNANGVVLASVLLFVLFAPRDTYGKLARTVLVAVLGVVLVFTFSRGAFVGLAAGCVVALAVQARTPRRVARVVGISALLALVFVGTGLYDLVQRRLAARPDTLANRYVYIDFGIHTGLANPLFGGGLGRATYENGAFVHATVISLFGDAGVFAAVGYLGLVVAVGLAGWQACRAIVAGDRWPACLLLPPLLGMHVCGFVASLTFDALLQRQWWVVMGAIAGISAARPTLVGRRGRRAGTTPTTRPGGPGPWADPARAPRRPDESVQAPVGRSAS